MRENGEHSEAGAREVKEKALEAGVRAETFGADFRNAADAIRTGKQPAEFLGGLDLLVNNAGITLNMPFARVTVEQFDALYRVNIRAQFFLTQAVLPHLIRVDNAANVNIASVHAMRGYAEHAGTKGAIVSYTRQLEVELAPHGIRVNAIAPGAITVESHYEVISDYDPEAFGNQIPAGFVGEPADIAHAAVFLAMTDARYIVGQTIVVDGGTTSWLAFSDAFRQRRDMDFGRGYVSR